MALKQPHVHLFHICTQSRITFTFSVFLNRLHVSLFMVGMLSMQLVISRKVAVYDEEKLVLAFHGGIKTIVLRKAVVFKFVFLYWYCSADEHALHGSAFVTFSNMDRMLLHIRVSAFVTMTPEPGTPQTLRSSFILNSYGGYKDTCVDDGPCSTCMELR